MRKGLLTCLILLLALAVTAQKKTTINLIKSERGINVKINGLDVFKVYKGIFKQQYSTLQSDSAYVHVKDNTFEAFGHVIIIQGDTLHIYADSLNYNDNTKIAILTNNVKMVDKDATLTTNNFNYNTATRYGIYVNGGKLVNKDNVLTSLNGYYFAQSRDAYFRYNVRLTTPDALIKTDTLRYNSGSRIAYFYGPTDIYGKKDNDTLYTENGTYNTKIEQAFFGKKNLYKQGTKSLKGDSLFYDRLKGYGRAIKNVTFTDKEQKITIKGNLGECYKTDDRAVITQNPYVIFVTEEKDTTKTDSVNKTAAVVPPKADSLQQAVKNTMPRIPGGKDVTDALIPKNISKGKIDSVTRTAALMASAKLKDSIDMASMQKQISQSRVDSVTAALGTGKLKDSIQTKQAINKLTKTNIDSIARANAPLALALATNATKGIITDTAKRAAASKGKPVKAAAKAGKTPVKNTQPVAQAATPVATDTAQAVKPVIPLNDTVAKNRPDTMYIGADTLETRMLTYKELKDLQEQRRIAGIRDTSTKFRAPFVPYTSIPKELFLEMPQLIPDSVTYINRPLFVAVKPAPADTDTTQKAADNKVDAKKTPGKKIANAKPVVNPIENLMEPSPPPDLPDTARVRILSAHHNVKIFKSDLQGKADSLFYSSSDSIIRNFVKPMYWAQGSQLSGDTIYMQLKNKKLYKMDVFAPAFAVNTEKLDTAHFNQVSGKRIRAYFKDSKIDRIIDYGNAEAIYWKRDSGKVTGMNHSLSSSIDTRFKKGEVSKAIFLIKHDDKYFPLKLVKEDDKILKGFIWKPGDRPANKEAVIHPVKAVPPPVKTVVPKGAAAKSKAKGSTAKSPGKDSVSKAGSGGKTTGAAKAAGQDSVSKTAPGVKPATAAGKDSVTTPVPNGKPVSAPQPGGKDTVSTPPAKPAAQARRDTTLKADTLKKQTLMQKGSVKQSPNNIVS